MISSKMKMYKIFKYMLKDGCIYYNGDEYKIYGFYGNPQYLLFIKNMSRCEISIKAFYKICSNISDGYYNTIIHDSEHHGTIKIFDKESLKVLLNSFILLIMEGSFHNVTMSMSMNDMLDGYLNLKESERKNLIEALRKETPTP